MSECAVDGCARTVSTSGLCNAHYLRKWRYGDPTKGGTHKRAAQEFIVTALLYERDDCLKWPFATVNGYGQIRMNGKLYLATRVVCEAEHGAPKNEAMEAAHSCANGHLGCINPKHLYWADHATNMNDMAKHGNSNRGRSVKYNRLSPNERKSLLSEIGTTSKRSIALKYGVTPTAIAYHERKTRANSND